MIRRYLSIQNYEQVYDIKHFKNIRILKIFLVSKNILMIKKKFAF